MSDCHHYTSPIGVLRLRPKCAERTGFTLLELLLALALVVVATSLIGSLISLYARSFATRGEDVSRKQLARSVLAMIADDIRAVVVEHSYDGAVFNEMFGDADMAAATMPSSSDATGSGASSSSPSATSLDSTSDLSANLNSSLPSGLYGNQYQLMVDVSRIPRVEEYYAQQGGLTTLTDVPGEIKRVSYFVQAPNPSGVQDVMNSVSSMIDNSGVSPYAGGLVRRQLDRAVTLQAEATSSSLQLMATGDLIAPEVVSLEFAYFDGTQWTYQWDSSVQNLPRLIQITLAMQSATGATAARIEPGISLSTLDYSQRQMHGIEVYELTVVIPGSQLQTAEASTGSTSTGSTGASSSTSSGGTNP